MTENKEILNFFKKIWASINGRKKDKLSDIGFHAMSFAMEISDRILGYSKKNFRTLDLLPGQTVIDYGCGPGRYLYLSSKAVGEEGKVIGVDIHPIAGEKVKKMIHHMKLENVNFILADGYSVPIESGIADVVYALEVFHMVKEPSKFLKELSRLVKKDGVVIVEDGHQPRKETIMKIKNSAELTIESQTRNHVKCRKIF